MKAKKKVTKKTLIKKASSKKTIAKKASSKKSPTKKASSKKTITKKTITKKASSKKSPIKNEILLIRKKSKLTQVQFANKIGISQSHLCKIEQGEQTINMAMAKELHKHFKVPTNKLLQL